MTCRIRDVSPAELSDAVEPGEVTLVLGAPAVGKSHSIRTVGPSVSRLSEIETCDDDALVVVDDFVSALFSLGDESWWDYAHGVKSLHDRAGGVVLVTRPRSFDWACQHTSLTADFVEAVDTVVVVRTPPSAATAAIDGIRATLSTRQVAPVRDEDLAQVLDRCTYPASQFETPALQKRLGWYDATVTPAAFVSLSKHDETAVLVAADVRRALADRDVSVGPLTEDLLTEAADLVPRGGLASRVPSDCSPAVRTAVALVAIALETDGDWLDPFVQSRPLAPAAEALEIELDLPPGTVEFLRLFAAEAPRARIRERFGEAGTLQTEDVDLDVVGAAMATVASALEAAAWTPEEYGSSPLVGAWDSDGPAALAAAATDRAFPDSDGARVTDDRVAGVAVDEVVAALDGGLVVLSGPKGRGKRRLAATVAAALTAWGTTVELPDLHQPDHVATMLDATPNVVVMATYGGDPGRIVSDDGVRALVDWVADGVCTGALLVCDDDDREQFDAVCERAGCADRQAWQDRVAFDLDDGARDAGPDREPAAIARDLLDAMGWPDAAHPDRWSVDVETVTDQSQLAAIAGVSDADLDAEFVGQVFADAVTTIAETAGPDAATQWLSLVDDLLADVARNRYGTDGVVTYRGVAYGTAMAAVATADPTTDEWVGAIADRVIALTNETAAPYGQESVGGDREPGVSAFGIALATLARPADGTGPNHGALACVDQVLHRTVDAGAIAEEPGLTVLCRIYGEMAGRIVESVDDLATADDALGPVAALVQQAAATNDDGFAAFVIGNSFGATLGAVAGAARSVGDCSTWVDALGSRIRESVAFIQHEDHRETLLRYAYSTAIGYWAFEHDCPDDRLGPWLAAVGRDLSRTATRLDLHDPAAFVGDVYGQAVRHVVSYRDRDRADVAFGACDRFVATVAASDLAADADAEDDTENEDDAADGAEDEWDRRAALHAEALAAFARIEHDADGIGDGPYGIGELPVPDSVGFADWIELYVEAVRRAAVDAPSAERERFLTAVYRGALSTHVDGFDGEPVFEGSARGRQGSESGISPRQERIWFTALTDCIETGAGTADLVDDPVAFLRGVYGDAAVRWAAEGVPSSSGEWIDSLVDSFRVSRGAIDGPSKTAWFDAFADADAAVLQAVLTRPNVGERTHERLLRAATDRIEAAATAEDHPPHPVVYVQSAYGTALALAVEADPAEVRFGVTELVTAVEERIDVAWVGTERVAIFERIYATALAVVGRTYGDHENVEAWLSVVTDCIEATATRERPDDPAAFVAGVYTRAYVAAVDDRADAWRQYLDSELRAYATGGHVDDAAAFLEGVYADAVIEGTTKGQPAAEIEACVSAVQQSVAAASEAGLARPDEPAVRTLSRAAVAFRSENPHARADHTYLFGQALEAVGGEALETAVFDAADGDARK
jgi:hypothetical protein